MKKSLKKFVSAALAIVLALSFASCAKTGDDENSNTTQDTSENATLSDAELKAVKEKEIRGIWMSFSEIGAMIKANKTEKSFTNTLDESFKKIKDAGYNTVFFHVRAYSDAFYNSSIFPSCSYFTGKQGGKAPYDPLKIACSLADKYSLKIEAWINPYRISTSQDLNKVADSSPAKKWLCDDDKSNDTWVMKVNGGGMYYNPAVDECIDLIVNGIKEIVDNYDVDGIHFDDYFYPVADAYIDQTEYKKYTDGGGTLTLEQWRRENVSKLVKRTYETVKGKDKSLLFGISPDASIGKNYDTLFADVEKWAGENGYLDYICPQIYFGFDSLKMPFVSTVKKWQSLVRESNVKLYIGLGLYKSGEYDKFAQSSENPEDKQSPGYEFVNNCDIMSRQIKYIRNLPEYDGFAVYSYSYMFNGKNENVKKEAQGIISMMKN